MLIKVHYEKIQPACNAGSRQFQKAFTLIEVVISMLIVLISLGGIISVYTQAAVSSDWSAHSLSAQMMALYGLEQCREPNMTPEGARQQMNWSALISRQAWTFSTWEP